MPKGKKKQPWHRQPGEGFAAHELLMIYISLGGERSVPKVAEASGRVIDTCQQLSFKFHWTSRAKAYDDWMMDIQEKAVEEALTKDAITYAQRRSRFRELEATLAQDLIDVGLQMVKAPLYETIVAKTEMVKTIAHPEGEPIAVTIINTPAKWTKRDGVAYLKVASEIMRLSLEMETSRVGGAVNMDDPKIRLEMARASLDKLRTNVDKLVDEEMAANPQLDRGIVTLRILEKLPEWVSNDWKLPADMLPLLLESATPEDVLPLIEGTEGESVH